MRYIRLRVWLLFAFLITAVVLLFVWSSQSGEMYKSETPISDTLVTNTYPRLYEAVYQRDHREIAPFLSHEGEEVRAQAWRVLAATPVDSVDPYIELAAQQNSEAGWFAISKQPLSERHLRDLEQIWETQQDLQPGIAMVLGQQGDRQSLDFLLSKIDDDISENERYALGISRLIIRHEIEEEAQIRVLQKAFNTSRADVRRNYLYGWYRGAQNALAPAAKDTLLSRWREQGLGISRTLDQYGNKIFPGRTYTITNFYNGEQQLEREVQLSIELANSLDKVEMTSQNSLAAKILLTHPNAHVKKQTLRSITGKMATGDDLFTYITQSMISDTLSRSSEGVWLEALRAAASVDSSIATEYGERIERVVEENPYLMPVSLAIYRSVWPANDFLHHIRSIIDEAEALRVMYAVESLADFWQGLEDREKTEERINQLRQMVFDALALQDRGVAYAAAALLEEEELFEPGDFGQINQTLADFSLPGDIEVFQQYSELYKKQFEQQARPVIDSLAAMQYPPLNRSLAKSGWEIPEEVNQETNFRMPDWDRLWELGANPRWRLQTAKGTIVIRMDPLKAPATVSAIDSLSRAGAYDGVPFHRVVPNFVIQGGDVERSDGFGGTEFVLPTESAEFEFARGAAGIASAGTDTEGSQYFIMLQWAPHLNGNYTRFGMVEEGMEVVDRIEKGDRVLSTSWY